jgi:uncharacterized protein (DUF488 family)
MVTLNVTLVLDVRERAWSQRPEFRKRRLEAALAVAGIAYRHSKELGNPFRPVGGSANAASQAHSCLALYRTFLAAREDAALAPLVGLRGEVVALLCYERQTAHCHRAALLDLFVDRLGATVNWTLDERP